MYKHVTFEEGKRIIAISNIHGDLATFKKLLEKCEYNDQEDYLIILGGFLEKGTEILATLRYIMEISQNERVFVLKGNNDRVIEGCSNEKDIKNSLGYLNRIKNSIMCEKARELDMVIQNEDDIKEVASHLVKEKEFIDNLPLVLVSDRLVFVHAGIRQLETETDQKFLLGAKSFANTSHELEQYVVVGHFPVSNYCTKIFRLTPLFDMEKRIISIDGGNNMKSFGQLNALIIENFESGLTFTYRYATHFPQKLIKISQKGNEEDARVIAWPNYDVKMLSQGEDESLVLNKQSDYLKVKNVFLRHLNDKWEVTDDYTNYVHEINRPVLADIVYEDDTSYLANIDGVIGWIYK